MHVACGSSYALYGTMAGLSALQRVKTTLVTLLLFAHAYGLEMRLASESSDEDAQASFRKVARKVRPDKGRSAADTHQLNAARDRWQAACSCSRCCPGTGSNSCLEAGTSHRWAHGGAFLPDVSMSSV